MCRGENNFKLIVFSLASFFLTNASYILDGLVLTIGEKICPLLTTSEKGADGKFNFIEIKAHTDSDAFFDFTTSLVADEKSWYKLSVEHLGDLIIFHGKTRISSTNYSA